jgi:integrase
MQGISVYTRPGRPTFYVAYDCPLRARRVCESSNVRLDDPRGKLAAYAYAREKSASGVMHGQPREATQWNNWVEPWLRMRFANKPKTLTSYLGAWKFLSAFLHEHKIPTPRALIYQHAVDFVNWRQSQKKRSGRLPGRNTALHNCKVMSRIMREAVRRNYCVGNPWFRLSEDIPEDPVAEKPEFTDADVARIRAEFARPRRFHDCPDWMPIAFEIALLQGCRLRATQIPMERIDLEHDTIQFHEKGGKVFTAPIHPELRPLLVRLKADGRKQTCTLPHLASRTFTRMLRRIGLPHVFHCTRVTVVTRFARASVPEQQAMAYVAHGGWAVHRIYQRLKPADVRGCHAALSFGTPSAPAPTPARPQNQDARPATTTPLPGSNTGRKKSRAPAPALRATG